MSTRLKPLGEGLHEMQATLGPFPIRMTVMQTESGLTLWSPVAMAPAEAEAIRSLGPVRSIVAPNLFHHVHLKNAMEHFPEATLHAPQELSDKNPCVRPETLAPSSLDELQVHRVEGALKIQEHIAYHETSRTLVLTDLLFNVRKARGLRQWFVFRLLAGTLGKTKQSRLWRFFRDNHALYQESIEAMLALPFERVVVAHGEVIETRAKDVLRDALL